MGSTKRAQSKVLVEQLEGRRLLSTTLWNAAGTYNVTGNDTITVTQSVQPGFYILYVNLNGSSAGSFTMGAADVLKIDAGAGDDDVFASAASVAVSLHGGDGNDSLVGGANNDTLYPGAGDDTIFGNDGNDYSWGDTGKDYMEGCAGSDTVNGGDGDDLLLGGKGDDTIYSGQGSDNISAGDGNDYVGPDDDATSGYDSILGGTGNDTLFGSSSGGCMIQAGAGNDTMTSFRVGCYLYGNEGDDIFNTENNTADFAIRGGDGYDIATVDRYKDTGAGVLDSLNVVTSNY